MRIPSDLTADPSPRRRHRARWWLIGFVVVLIILLVSLRSLAGLYTDSLWFSSVDLHNVFSTLLAIKLGLFGVFGAIFFAVLWVNLVVCDRIAGHDVVLAQDDELVRRYQQFVRPYAGRIYVGLAFVLALIGASGTVGQWNNWILFRHGGNFGVTDPQFHKDIGFYVFKLPFLTFIVDWTLAILIVTLAVSLVFHYFNGGIQPQRGLPRVRPPVKAHISVLLALIALDKAAGYVLQRWSLVNSQDGYVNGAGYTDVHARLPAETLLDLRVDLRRGDPALQHPAPGLDAPGAGHRHLGLRGAGRRHHLPGAAAGAQGHPGAELAGGAVHPAQHHGHPDAYGLNNVQVHQFPAQHEHHRQPDACWRHRPSTTSGSGTPTRPSRCRRSSACRASSPTTRSRRWAWTATRSATQRTPVLIGVRDISAAGVPSPSWVNTHLQYTHGNGAAVALSNQTNSNNPVLRRAGRAARPRRRGCRRSSNPTSTSAQARRATSWRTPSSSRSTTRSNGNSVESHYTGTGGVQLSSIFTRAAFALRLGDFNLLISSQITNKSRIMFVRDPVTMAQKAAPFLTFDHDPYAVINRRATSTGSSTATRRRPTTPTRRTPDTQQVAVGSNLPGSYNYVRNSVKVVIDAYSGKMTFYDADPQGPDSAGVLGGLPEHVHADVEDAGIAAGAPALPAGHLLHSVRHLRALPPDQPEAFYAASNAWQLSPTAGAGPQSQALLAENTYNNQGQLVSTTPARMAPQYQVYSLPGHRPRPNRSSPCRTVSSRRRRRTSRGTTRTST